MSTGSVENAATPAGDDFGNRAKSGTHWVLMAFGLGQAMRLVGNLVLAALLYEEVFALMAIVLAVMFGLAMFSDIGLKTNVVQHPRGDDPDFLNTAWTLQVLRGVLLFVMTLVVAWPVSRFYGANDPKAFELLYLIPMAGLSALASGFESAKMLTAARHLRIKEVTKIEVVAGMVGFPLTMLLAWHMRSVYAIALASVLGSVVQMVLSYHMLEGPRSRFRWDHESVRTIFSFGKWVFVSTLFTFSAAQIDRLAFGAMYPLAEVGVYSIAVGLAVMVPTLVGRLQTIVLFPWYSRMLSQGTPLSEVFDKTRPATLVASTYLCTLLVVGSSSFFDLAYDDRYALGGVLLPALAIGGWFSCLDSMYGSAFLASGRPKWTAFTNAFKVVAFLALLVPLSLLELDITKAALAIAICEALRWGVSNLMGRRLGLRGGGWELAALVVFLSVSGVQWWLLHHWTVVSELAPFWRLALVGAFTSALFAPLFLRFVLPLLRKR